MIFPYIPGFSNDAIVGNHASEDGWEVGYFPDILRPLSVNCREQGWVLKEQLQRVFIPPGGERPELFREWVGEKRIPD